ncbi:glycosyltransferase family 2 protein [Niveispirillum irakense]|uniref:glycosyltransferase family 2 protein n=1 Tax=Niveispirillum irakense TaxID=34011 RepID=UPI000490DFBE|nr:glycosyltransferase family 2 protein [Niveispirillum irakense]
MNKELDVFFGITVVIVTHNSQASMAQTMDCLKRQTVAPNEVIIVDSGSSDTSYLDEYKGYAKVLLEKNIGFCAANNLAIDISNKENDVLLLNPDLFLPDDWMEKAISIFNSEKSVKVGAFSGPLLGYDLEAGKPSGLVDVLGIYRKWYGLWFNQGQGQPIENVSIPDKPFEPTALCGALMLIRRKVLSQLRARWGFELDPSLFMYKDDIDLSLRIKGLGWDLLVHPELWAYHCRGWAKDRNKASVWGRRISALNEIKLAYRFRSPFIIIYMMKYFYVRYIETGK